MYWMKRLLVPVTLCLVMAAPQRMFGQPAAATANALPPGDLLTASADIPSLEGYSSSLTSETALAASPAEARLAIGSQEKPAVLLYDSIRPFSTAAVAVNIGTGGVGFQVATPLSRRFNLRGSGSIFPYNLDLLQDGINFNGSLRFASGAASIDFYPWAGSFRISPGVVFYNDNHAFATADVPGGQTFTLDNTTYTSSSLDPIHGTGSLTLGRKVGPSLTVGFGNMIPRSGKHFSFPFEFGVAYVGEPTLVLGLQGTSCDSFNNCGNVATDAPTQANLRAEQNSLANDLAPLRLFPIVSMGISYKF